jgi:hypothetical protein
MAALFTAGPASLACSPIRADCGEEGGMDLPVEGSVSGWVSCVGVGASVEEDTRHVHNAKLAGQG